MNTSQINKELQGIVSALTELTGLPSKWSGVVELVPEADFKGKKRFICDIQIDADLAQQEVRWATLIHEALHAVSSGYVGTDYRDAPGWEEGVVEWLQRFFRPTIVAKLEVRIPDEVFQEAQAKHNYNKYIDALERLRLELNLPAEGFYMRLLKTPIKERSSFILGLGNQLSNQERITFLRVFSAANSILKDFV